MSSIGLRYIYKDIAVEIQTFGAQIYGHDHYGKIYTEVARSGNSPMHENYNNHYFCCCVWFFLYIYFVCLFVCLFVCCCCCCCFIEYSIHDDSVGKNAKISQTHTSLYTSYVLRHIPYYQTTRNLTSLA